MTAVGKLFADEKEQYGKDCEAKGIKEGLKLGKMIGEANTYVEMVQKRVQTRDLSELEACADLDIDLKYYEMAKALIASQPEEEAV